MLSPFPQQKRADPTHGDTFNAFLRQHGQPEQAPPQTILLVDDDDALREVMEACLGTMGYVVMACRDAQSASRAFRSSRVDLLLTDLQMPGRSGAELARELTQIRPELPVIIISGSILADELTAEIERRRWKFIAKPCSMAHLAGTMQTLLTTASQANTW